MHTQLEFWRAGETEPQSCATVQLYPVQLHAAILAAAATAVVPWATSMTQGFKKAFFLDVCKLFARVMLSIRPNRHDAIITL